MNKKTIGTLVLGLLLGGGSIGAYQVAAQNNNAVKTPSTVKQQKVQNPLYRGSIVIDNAKYEGKNEQGESTALASKAKITANQAKKIAEAKVGSTASAVKLANENGSLVYEVKTAKQEIKVDAGNGNVLKIGQADNKKEQADNKKEQADNKKEGKEAVESEKVSLENGKGGDIKKDGILHQFEGQEGHAD